MSNYDDTSTAVRERCAECGGALGSIRRLMPDVLGTYRPVHFTCAHAYRRRIEEMRQPPRWLSTDTSGRSP